jgi:hypothetical protein
MIMRLDIFSDRELDALIADRNANWVFASSGQGAEDFYLFRNGERLGIAQYSTHRTMLTGERAAGILTEDPTGLELYDRATAGDLSAREHAEAFIRYLVADPEARLALIRSRAPTNAPES